MKLAKCAVWNVGMSFPIRTANENPLEQSLSPTGFAIACLSPGTGSHRPSLRCLATVPCVSLTRNSTIYRMTQFCFHRSKLKIHIQPSFSRCIKQYQSVASTMQCHACSSTFSSPRGGASYPGGRR